MCLMRVLSSLISKYFTKVKLNSMLQFVYLQSDLAVLHYIQLIAVPVSFLCLWLLSGEVLFLPPKWGNGLCHSRGLSPSSGTFQAPLNKTGEYYLITASTFSVRWSFGLVYWGPCRGLCFLTGLLTRERRHLLLDRETVNRRRCVFFKS